MVDVNSVAAAQTKAHGDTFSKLREVRLRGVNDIVWMRR
jgi:hypothetical protein